MLMHSVCVGTQYFSIGTRYTGGWKDGKEHGPGEYTLRDGTTHRAVWRHGERSDQQLYDWVYPSDDRASASARDADDARASFGHLESPRKIDLKQAWISHLKQTAKMSPARTKSSAGAAASGGGRHGVWGSVAGTGSQATRSDVSAVPMLHA